jgi:hypothetical protein
MTTAVNATVAVADLARTWFPERVLGAWPASGLVIVVLHPLWVLCVEAARG